MILTIKLAAVFVFAIAAVTRAAAASERHGELVRYDDIVIETIVEGAGPAIVMLPSTGRDGLEDFDEVAGKLAAGGFTVLRPQPRGIGKSTGPMEGVSLHDFARDVATVISQLGNGRAIIVGHAYGHFVARMTAVDYPAEVRGVVLAAAASRQYPRKLAGVPGRIADQALPEAERLHYLKLAFFAHGHDPSEWLAGWYPKTQAMQRDGGDKQGVKQSDWWSAGTAPLLELIPDQDPFKPKRHWTELRDEFGERVTTVVIPDASHALFPEQPAAVAAAIIPWARELPP
jgi:pimeloyl-ACP methyl ester carboxylesterase